MPLPSLPLPSLPPTPTTLPPHPLQIPPSATRQSYIYDSHVFHYVVSGSLTYLCMSDSQNQHRLPFAFLSKVEEVFTSKYGSQALTAIAFSMNEEFSPVLKKEMEFYNNNPEADAVTKVKGQIEDVKNVMVENIEKVLERGEKIEVRSVQDRSTQHDNII